MSNLKDSFPSLFRIDGKIALITGGSRGVGFYTAEAFLRAGAAKVFLTARKAEGVQGLDQAVAHLNSIRGNAEGWNGHAVGIAADVSKTCEIERLVAEIKKSTDKLDILVANAGATWGGPFEPTPDSSNVKVLDINVRSIFNLARLSVPLLAKAGSSQNPSRVIIVGSTAGLSVPLTGKNGTIMYSVSKAAAHHLARNLAVELGPRNITTNTVAPGFFPTKLASGIIKTLGLKELAESNPLGRLGEPGDIAGAMLYLCSPAGKYANGVTIVLDGGTSLAPPTESRL